jgi:hypothetical protein
MLFFSSLWSFLTTPRAHLRDMDDFYMDIETHYNKFPCKRCGRVGTQKDVEGARHHNTGVVCLDQKDCRKARRKQKRHA